MTEAVFAATIDRIAEHCESSGQRHVHLTFHGGEPLLVGIDRLSRWCAEVRRRLANLELVAFSLQTNGTLIDDEWASMFREFQIDVGVSVDGPPEIHDAYRIDRHGRGSYRAVERGLKVLDDHCVPYGVLCVIPLGADPRLVHQHFVDLGVPWIDYLLPGYLRGHCADPAAFRSDTMCRLPDTYS
jgi:uncharacterized protein